MVSRITVELIKEVHRSAILSGFNDESSLIDLVRDEGTLFFISERSNSIESTVGRASFLLFSIAHYHPFVEGNKRTAVLVAELVLGPHLHIDADEHELNRAIRKIGSEVGTNECAEKWLKKYVKKIE